MKITEVSGQYAKLSPNSITVKDGNGKTRGIVRATCWRNLPPRTAADWWRILRDSGLWGSRYNVNTAIYLCDGKLYWLYNTSSDDYYLEHKDKLQDTDLRDCYAEHAEFLTRVEASPITVIRYKSV